MNRPHPPTAFTIIGLFERVRRTDISRARRLTAATAAFFLAFFSSLGTLASGGTPVHPCRSGSTSNRKNRRVL